VNLGTLLARFGGLLYRRHRDTQRDLGRYGEEQARRFLRRKGYRIVAANEATPLGEVDIVLRQGSTLVCVEVKTRLAGGPHDTVEAISADKLERMKRCAEYVGNKRAVRHLDLRLDAVFVTVDDSGGTAIEHVENIS